jgi:hypothetical protein
VRFNEIQPPESPELSEQSLEQAELSKEVEKFAELIEDLQSLDAQPKNPDQRIGLSCGIDRMEL